MNLGKENEKLEFKESTAELRGSLCDICAILNKHFGGILYFGVKNNGEVIGMQIGKDTTKDIVKEIRAHIKPSCVFEVNELSTDEGIKFIEVSFSGNNTPYSAYDRYYLRFDDVSSVMDGDLLLSYFQSLNNDYSMWEESDSTNEISSIDEELLKDYIKRGNEIKRIPFKYINGKDALSKMHLLCKNGNLNNAGNVLFSKNKPVTVKYAVFATDTRSKIIDLKIYNGNVFECINESMTYIKSHINYGAVFTGDIRRVDVPEIPLVAIREIVVNAFAHGSYNSNTEFEICLYKNRLTIYSPGHFPKPYTPEQFANESLEPIPFNPKIVEVLYGDETIEKYSTGFDRTFNALKESNINYDYLDTGFGFRFTFYRPGGAVNGLVNGVVKLNSNEESVYNSIKKNPNITIKELSEHCNLSTRTIQRILLRLKESEIITRIGSDKTGYWKAKE